MDSYYAGLLAIVIYLVVFALYRLDTHPKKEGERETPMMRATLDNPRGD